MRLTSISGPSYRHALVWEIKLVDGTNSAEFLLRGRFSPWKQPVQILWESGGQRWHTVKGNRTGATPMDGQE